MSRQKENKKGFAVVGTWFSGESATDVRILCAIFSSTVTTAARRQPSKISGSLDQADDGEQSKEARESNKVEADAGHAMEDRSSAKGGDSEICFTR
jgi:hypothetical protein